MLYALALDANSWNDARIAYYNRVKMCFPGRFENDDGSIVYRVYGRQKNICDISERKDSIVYRCLFPTETSKEYASAGLKSMKEDKDKEYMLSDFLSEVEESKRYCKIYRVAN